MRFQPLHLIFRHRCHACLEVSRVYWVTHSIRMWMLEIQVIIPGSYKIGYLPAVSSAAAHKFIYYADNAVITRPTLAAPMIYDLFIFIVRARCYS